MLGNPFTARAWYKAVYTTLLPTIKNPHECKAITRRLLSHYLPYNLTEHLLDNPLKADDQTYQKIQHAIQRLKKNEPIQYILGSAPFLSHNFYVNSTVLIPRPETEEMVHTLIKENNLANKQVLDIGTGSGCIAITIKKAHPTATVHALDISLKALQVAKKNAKTLQVAIHFHLLNILQEPLLPKIKWHLIVSNPPYIPEREKESLHPNVLDHEPALALFVPDENPLIFYQKIAQIAQKTLHPKGKLYIECHSKLIQNVKTLFEKKGFHKITSHDDLQGKQRSLVIQQ